jgi:transposase
VTDDSDLAALRRRGDDADEDPVLPGATREKARARAALSAPGRLRQMVVQAARRRGVQVREVAAEFLTRTCPACGVTSDAHPRYAASARVVCPACGHSYDQDFSAAELMLARAAREVAP